MSPVAAPPIAAPDPGVPTRFGWFWFAARAERQRLRRLLAEIGRRPPRHLVGRSLASAPVIAEFASPLWPDDEADPRLVAGKIHNLRLARKALDGLEIPAGAMFSFWRQLGRADARRGYVDGRELREGCLVPAIGGGLCQLSNGLYNVALRAGLEIVERHRHSRVLPGSLAEQDRDATVFWNYLDLRLRSPQAWRLEVEMDARELRIRLRASSAGAGALPLAVARRGEGIGDCATCDRRSCHRFTGVRRVGGQRTWLTDPAWPETAIALADADAADRRFDAVPVACRRQRLADALRWRLARWRGTPLVEFRLQQRARQARAVAARLRPDDLHLVVAQGLLPFLWRDGELAGRRFDVLMDALPMAAIQQRLDAAVGRHPQAASLGDFRAPPALIAAEAAALAAAETWLSPHAQVLALAGARARALPWRMPAAAPRPAPRRSAPSRQAPSMTSPPLSPPPVPRLPRLLFPASTLARKGALELREALRGLPLRLLLPPGASESADFWRGLAVEPVATIAAGLASADAVVLPAWVEHQPRALLAAIARGLPVIATPACGLSPSAAWIGVPEGDVAALRSALTALAAALSPAAAAGRQ